MELSFQKRRTTKTKNDPISFGKNLFSNNSSLNGYELLAMAVVNQAAEDYRRALKSSALHGGKTTDAIALERFFLSEWGDLLCFGMGDLILEKLQKEFESGNRIKTKPYFSAKRGVGRKPE